MINKSLAHTRKISKESIKEIKRLHKTRESLYSLMEITPEDSLPAYDIVLTIIEQQLQKLWNFYDDPKYIKFWIIPRCTCPVMDNEERYPYGMYVYNKSCPVHNYLNQE